MSKRLYTTNRRTHSMALGFIEEDVSARLEKIIQAQIGSDTALSPETHLQDDLGMDSLELVELGIALENAFAIELPGAVMRRCATLGDLVQLVRSVEPEEKVRSV
jgi:acyl carrier protein